MNTLSDEISKMEFNFSGKRILVTGGSRGIGRAIVKELLVSGAEVYALGKSLTNLEKLKTDFPSVHIVNVDLADWKTTRDKVESIGQIDFLINNAGFSDFKAFLDCDKTDVDKNIDVNLKAAFNVSQVVARNMIQRGNGGSIVNISSIAGIMPFMDLAPYCISKAGLDMLTKTMALELGPHNIRVNSVCPSSVRTETFSFIKTHPTIHKMIDATYNRQPIGRIMDPEEVVYPTLFLLSDNASKITGTILRVDGGYCIS